MEKRKALYKQIIKYGKIKSANTSITNEQQLSFPNLVQAYIYKHHNFKLIFNKFKNIIGLLSFCQTVVL